MTITAGTPRTPGKEAIETCEQDVALLASMGAERLAKLDAAVWETCTAGLEGLWNRPEVLGEIDRVSGMYATVAEFLEPIAWETRRDLLPILADMRLFGALVLLRAGALERGTRILEKAIEPMAMLARFGDETGEGYGAAVVIARRLCGAVARGAEGAQEARELVAVLLAAAPASAAE